MHLDTYPLRGEMRDPDAMIARCRGLGLDHVCLSVGGWPGDAGRGPDPADLKRFVRRLNDAGIQAPVIINSFGADPGMLLDPVAGQAKIVAACRLLETIGQAGIGVLLNYLHPPMPRDPDDDARYWDGLIRAYRQLVVAAEANDVRIANHAIWRCLPDGIREQALAAGATIPAYRAFRVEGWDGPYFLTSHGDVARLLEAAPSSHNGVCLCTGMHIMGGDVPALIDRFGDKIFYAQMRDVRGRWPAAEEVFLGEGDLDFTDILRRLAAVGYTGTVGAEHLGAPRYPGEDQIARAVTFLRARLAEATAAPRGAA